MIKQKTFLAFTLAEVLIVILVLGFVAMLTIPTLIDKINDARTVTGLKKAYATLNIAYEQLVSDYDNSDVVAAIKDNDSSLVTALTSKLRVLKDCGVASAKATGCFPDTTYEYLENGISWINVSTNGDYDTILLVDGMAYAIHHESTNCTANYSNPTDTNSPLYYTCGYVWIDIDGPNKGKAKLGRDTFGFYITQRGVFPWGAYSDYDFTSYGGLDAACKTNARGRDCAAKVLKDDNVNY
jgi:type II secretory pathway pseudopilin PulG